MDKARRTMPLEAAEAIAVQGLAFLAEDPVRLSRFLTLTGMEPDDVRAHASSPTFLAAVVDYIAADESLLLVFAANASIPPESIAPALHLLQGHR